MYLLLWLINGIPITLPDISLIIADVSAIMADKRYTYNSAGYTPDNCWCSCNHGWNTYNYGWYQLPCPSWASVICVNNTNCFTQLFPKYPVVLTYPTSLVVTVKDDPGSSNIIVALDDDSEKGAEHANSLHNRVGQFQSGSKHADSLHNREGQF